MGRGQGAQCQAKSWSSEAWPSLVEGRPALGLSERRALLGTSGTLGGRTKITVRVKLGHLRKFRRKNPKQNLKAVKRPCSSAGRRKSELPRDQESLN